MLLVNSKYNYMIGLEILMKIFCMVVMVVLFVVVVVVLLGV